jgi:hypothetical protein
MKNNNRSLPSFGQESAAAAAGVFPYSPRIFAFPDLFVIAVFAVIAVLLFMAPFQAKGGDTVYVYVNNSLYGSYRLHGDERVITVENGGHYNIILIKNGCVRISGADCPRNICAHQQYLSAKRGGSLICLPHRLIVTLGKSDVDSVTS